MNKMTRKNELTPKQALFNLVKAYSREKPILSTHERIRYYGAIEVLFMLTGFLTDKHKVGGYIKEEKTFLGMTFTSTRVESYEDFMERHIKRYKEENIVCRLADEECK